MSSITMKLINKSRGSGKAFAFGSQIYAQLLDAYYGKDENPKKFLRYYDNPDEYFINNLKRFNCYEVYLTIKEEIDMEAFKVKHGLLEASDEMLNNSPERLL